jgi:hypothetical protein
MSVVTSVPISSEIIRRIFGGTPALPLLSDWADKFGAASNTDKIDTVDAVFLSMECSVAVEVTEVYEPVHPIFQDAVNQ